MLRSKLRFNRREGMRLPRRIPEIQIGERLQFKKHHILCLILFDINIYTVYKNVTSFFTEYLTIITGFNFFY